MENITVISYCKVSPIIPFEVEIFKIHQSIKRKAYYQNTKCKYWDGCREIEIFIEIFCKARLEIYKFI